MFGLYALPQDDLLQDNSVSVTAEANEESAYGAVQLINEGPTRPAGITDYGGRWIIDAGSAISPVAAAALYHNIDAGTGTMRLEANSVNSWGSPAWTQDFVAPPPTEDGWPVSPWMMLDGSPSYRYWALAVDGPNAITPIRVGRLMLLGALRDLGNDVRWGVVEEEEHHILEHATDLGIETIYELGGKRRRFSGEFALQDDTAAEFITFVRSAKSRLRPWLLIPDATVNDAWIVRFEESHWTRTRETIGHNIFPYRVRELARGLPWP